MIGIMAAMPEEIAGLSDLMTERKVTEAGKRSYLEGKLFGKAVVLVFSRWGKVAASSTATTLINQFKVDKILFTGVAGAVHSMLRVGDIVIGETFIQHDLDAQPFFKRHEIPLLGVSEIKASREFVNAVKHAADQFAAEERLTYSPQVYRGQVVSGDRFFADTAALEELRGHCPDALCVEMEGAAVAQVCYEHGVDYVVVRTISDDGKDGAPDDFAEFVREVASHYSNGIVTRYIANI